MEEKFMREALKEAKKAYEKKEVPVGCVIVKDGKIIARGHNVKETKKDTTKHAEMIAIQKASKKLDSWRLLDCEMYVTLEPCSMCAGALIQCRIGKLVYATESEKFGYVESISNVLDNKNNNHHPIIVKNVCKESSQKLLKDFFKDKRN